MSQSQPPLAGHVDDFKLTQGGNTTNPTAQEATISQAVGQETSSTGQNVGLTPYVLHYAPMQYHSNTARPWFPTQGFNAESAPDDYAQPSVWTNRPIPRPNESPGRSSFAGSPFQLTPQIPQHILSDWPVSNPGYPTHAQAHLSNLLPNLNFESTASNAVSFGVSGQAIGHKSPLRAPPPTVPQRRHVVRSFVTHGQFIYVSINIGTGERPVRARCSLYRDSSNADGNLAVHLGLKTRPVPRQKRRVEPGHMNGKPLHKYAQFDAMKMDGSVVPLNIQLFRMNDVAAVKLDLGREALAKLGLIMLGTEEGKLKFPLREILPKPPVNSRPVNFIGSKPAMHLTIPESASASFGSSAPPSAFSHHSSPSASSQFAPTFGAVEDEWRTQEPATTNAESASFLCPSPAQATQGRWQASAGGPPGGQGPPNTFTTFP
ncbi:hypothetical protein G7046_g3565 [Stylonectria norvegica]|nr:hypothetical protein G7046_g3565 [Stylonectria norvegica]